ncbi:MAG: DinB family protein [Bacteroidetes bacterium]|nr:DinB family protein [Bacteroidota bacterium]
MRKLTIFLLLAFSVTVTFAQQKPKTPPTLKSILLQQFQNTWNQQDWFVPISQSLQGLTAQQAMWKPSDSSHSVGQLAYHLLFWNKQVLDKFNGRKPDKFGGDNNETFNAFTEASWAATVQQLEEVMKGLETAIKNSDDAKLQSFYDTLAHISTHNAYHVGQILYIRKLAGNWDAKKGVQ